MATTWFIELRTCFNPAVTATVVEMRACTALDDSVSLAGGAWTDGTYWTDLDDQVGWTDWPPPS